MVAPSRFFFSLGLLIILTGRVNGAMAQKRKERFRPPTSDESQKETEPTNGIIQTNSIKRDLQY